MGKEVQPLADHCVWIHRKDIIKSNHWKEELGGKLQHNYFTDKNDWHRGLDSLIKELMDVA